MSREFLPIDSACGHRSRCAEPADMCIYVWRSESGLGSRLGKARAKQASRVYQARPRRQDLFLQCYY
jgi:hypothetical protein